MTEYLQYTTVDGDRWDLIADRMYGDAWAFEPIITVNPHVPITPVLEGGIVLWIPIREPASVEASRLPPWKRG